jgi:enoyl-CoA hydratase
MSSLLLVDEPAPHVRRLALNRPDELNAMTAELCKALHDELVQTAARRSCRAGM